MVALEFVSISHPDDLRKKETRRRIGQHVMKDIGYSRRKAPNKKKGKPREENDLQATDTVQTLSKALKADEPTISNHDDPFKKSPFTALSRNLAARSARIENLYDGAFQLALADAVLYELVQPVGRFRVMEESPVAMQHYTACVAIVNQKIRKGTSTSQDLVGTIIALASYDLIVRKFERWVMHMKGLKNMMKMRGGIGSLGSKYLENAMAWTDVCGSLNTDSRPHFTANTQLQEQEEYHLHVALPMTLDRTLGTLRLRSSCFDRICTILRSLWDVSLIASKKPSTEWLNDEKLVQKITETSHLVLNLPRHGEQVELGTDAALHEAVRVAVLLFTMGPVYSLSGEKDLMLGKVGHIPSLLRSEVMDWTGLEELELWVLYTGARIEEGEYREWMVSQMCHRMKDMGLGLKGLEHVLHDIVWIDQALRSDTEGLMEQIRIALLDAK